MAAWHPPLRVGADASALPLNRIHCAVSLRPQAEKVGGVVLCAIPTSLSLLASAGLVESQKSELDSQTASNPQIKAVRPAPRPETAPDAGKDST